MVAKIDVESGNPYRDQSGHFGTSPDQALKDSFAALQGKSFVPKGKGGNKKLVAAKASEAKEKLSALRGGDNKTSQGDAPLTEEQYKTMIASYSKQAKFSSEQQREVEEYTGGTYYDINLGLRNAEGDMDAPDNVIAKDSGEKAQANEAERRRAQVKALDEAPRHELTEDTLLYRGLADAGTLEEGMTIQDYGFQSTSFNRTEAEGFVSKYSSDAYLLVISAKKGTKGIIPDAVSKSMNYGEQEMILERGTKYKVTKVEDGIAYVEVL